MSDPIVVDIGAAMQTLESNPGLVAKMNELMFGKIIAEQLAAKDAEIAGLRDVLERIAAHTDPDDPESYRCDDREGCLDTVQAIASAALKETTT
jgi:hypothetical protein